MLRVFQFSNGDRGRNGDCKTKGTYPRKCENFSAKALREIATMKTAWPSMFQRWTVGEICRRLCPTAILREIYLSSASLNAFSSFSSISFSLFFFLLFFAFYIFFDSKYTAIRRWRLILSIRPISIMKRPAGARCQGFRSP